VRRALLLALLASAGVGIGILAASRPATLKPGAAPRTADRAPLRLTGVVVAGDAPVPGAEVELFEMGADGVFPGPRTKSDAEGRFEVEWSPTLSDASRAFAALSAPGFPTQVAAAGGRTLRLEMRRAAAVAGRVLDHAGRPLAGARVAAAQPEQPYPARATVSGDDGSFSIDGFPEGAPVQIAATHPGRSTWVEGRFRAGEPVTIRPLPSAPVHLRLRTPSGHPVAGVEASLPAPPALRGHVPSATSDADGVVVLPDASGGSYVLVDVRAPAFVPLQVLAAAHSETEVVVWPVREVAITVWDSITGGGVAEPSLSIEPALPDGDQASWWGRTPEFLIPRYPLRRDRREGVFRIGLPACACEITGTAAGYVENTMTVSGAATGFGLPMQPLHRARVARLRLRPVVANGAVEGAVPLVLLDQETGWSRRVALGAEGAEIDVPPDSRIQIASAGAAGGFWVMRHEVDTPRAGDAAEHAVGLRAAIRVSVRVRSDGESAAPGGTATLFDPGMGEFDAPVTRSFEDGRATFWARPRRSLRVEIACEGDFFAATRRVEAASEDVEVVVTPLRSSALALRVVDAEGEAIPFARVRFWKPDAARGGLPELWADPEERRTDPWGRARFSPIDDGAGALDVAAEGFRGRRLARVEIPPSATAELPPFRLDPAPWCAGALVDYRGEAVRSACLRVLSPRVARLPIRGAGEFNTYDPEDRDGIEVMTSADGAFRIPDESPGAPVWWIRAQGRADLAPMALVPTADGERVTMPALAHLGVDVPGTVYGIYVVLPGGRAVLLHRDPPLSIRPVPLQVPAGPMVLHLRLRDGRSATMSLVLEPGETRVVTPEFVR